jgi:hypothetical protein
MGLGRQSRRMVCRRCSCLTLRSWPQGVIFARRFRGLQPRRVARAGVYGPTRFQDVKRAWSSWIGGGPEIVCGSSRRGGLLWGCVRGRLRRVRQHKSWQRARIRTIQNVALVVAGFADVGRAFIAGNARANAAVHPLLCVVVARGGEARPATPCHAAAATPPASAAISSARQTAAHGRVQAGVTASSPCCREAECLELLLVLWVHGTAIFERGHLLARLVVVVIGVVVFGAFARLDFAERASLCLSSQGPPQAGA